MHEDQPATAVEDSGDEVAGPAKHSGGASEPRGRRLGVWAGLLLVAAGVLGWAQAAAPEYSPLDEHTHAGSAWDIAHGTVPAAGSPVPEEVLQDWACSGQFNVDLPPCGADAELWQYPGSGQNYNWAHPPLYYMITGVAARAIDGAIPAVTFVGAARALSIVWIYAGMVLLYTALRRWRVDWRIASATAAAVPLMPHIMHAGTIVTNDAPAVLGGAAALLVLGRVLLDHKTQWWLPVILAGALASTKVLNALAMLSVAGVFLVFAVARKHLSRLDLPSSRRLVSLGLGIVGAVTLVFLTWRVLQSRRGDPNWRNPIGGTNTDPLEGGPGKEWLSTSLDGLDISRGSFVDVVLREATMTVWVAAATVILIAGVWAALVALSPRDPRWSLALATAGGLLAFPTVVQIQTYLAGGGQTYFPAVSTRYGMTMIPLILACWAFLLDRRRLVRVSGAVTALGLLLVVLTLAGLSPQ